MVALEKKLHLCTYNKVFLKCQPKALVSSIVFVIQECSFELFLLKTQP